MTQSQDPTETPDLTEDTNSFEVLDPADFAPSKPLELGSFSISLSVSDIDISIDFYEKLGFAVTGGDPDSGFVIMVNDQTVIGLFENMFEDNILTFNPGLSVVSGMVEHFTDIRDIQNALDERNIEIDERTDPEGTGIGHITLRDPDGNHILIDQHFPKPVYENDESE